MGNGVREVGQKSEWFCEKNTVREGERAWEIDTHTICWLVCDRFCEMGSVWRSDRMREHAK